MTADAALLAARYLEVLKDFVDGAGESARVAAYELGRAALAQGCGILDVTRFHADAAAEILRGTPRGEARLKALSRASELLAEALSPFEMAHRGFREANEELRRLNEKLEHRAAELAFANEELAREGRERKQLEAHLRHAHKMESIGTLAGGVAHDFNNLLNIISAHSALAGVEGIGEKRRAESLAAIQNAVRRGAALVRQLLTFARKSEMEFAPVDVNDVIDELAAMLRETFPKMIVFDTELARSLPTVHADHDQLMQALLNLCVNARDAMPEGGNLTISTGLEEGPALRQRFPEAGAELYVRIRVADSGVGMDEATRGRIFEPFFTTKEAGKGAGLGLSVVYGILKNHGGFIDVETAPKRGSAFSIWFPAVPTLARRPVGKEIPLAEPASRGGRETVLLVEDEETLLQALKSILEAEGYTVLESRSGPEALRAFESREGPVDLVLADLGLPGMTGWQTLLEIWKKDPDVRGIVASGFLDPDLKAQMLARGASALLQKPYSVDDVLAKIREALEKRPANGNR